MGFVSNGYYDVARFVDQNGAITTYSTKYLVWFLEYLINIVFIILIYTELKKQKIKSTPILVVTFLSSLIGVIFFLLFSAHNKLIAKF